MTKHLVLVESSTKCQLISKYLNQTASKGDKWEVCATLGHVRDLDNKTLSIDVDNGFKPTYVTLPNKTKIVSNLRTKLKHAEVLWLASDNDREGEAIAMHVKALLKPKCPCHRVVFSEITQRAITEAFANPKTIDANLVSAQETRRILDRLVGYKISPMLWNAFRGIKGLSAGRVQSAGLSLIVSREEEVNKYKPSHAWTIQASFDIDGHKVIGFLDKTFDDKSAVRKYLKDFDFDVVLESKKTSRRHESPPKPFKTSTLQQVAYSRFGFSSKKTMKLAQDLYEGGHITYMRTDSTQLSSVFQEMVQEYVTKEYGQSYVGKLNNSTGAPGAHEAIRPTKMVLGVAFDSPDLKRLYNMIWMRSIESLMSDEVRDVRTFLIKPGFVCTMSKVTFRGFTALSNPVIQDLIELPEGNVIKCDEVVAHDSWKQPPRHFTEGNFVKHLEKEGIGRPSTYATIVDKLLERNYIVETDIPGTPVTSIDYVRKKNGPIETRERSSYIGAEKKVFVATDTGRKVHEFVSQRFSYICDKKFTSSMEADLDEIAKGEKKSRTVLKTFWDVFVRDIGRVH